MDIKELIKDNYVKFDSYRQGRFYYNVEKVIRNENSPTGESIEKYQFTVPIDDIGTATLLSQDKAITYMRWIRKAINDNTLVCVR
jgi:hypothetical protein